MLHTPDSVARRADVYLLEWKAPKRRQRSWQQLRHNPLHRSDANASVAAILRRPWRLPRPALMARSDFSARFRGEADMR
jgi:hypothetical protein